MLLGVRQVQHILPFCDPLQQAWLIRASHLASGDESQADAGTANQFTTLLINEINRASSHFQGIANLGSRYSKRAGKIRRGRGFLYNAA